MDDRSWMYRDLPERLCKINYCNGVQGFINYKLSNVRNISVENIIYPCKSYKKYIYINSDGVKMHFYKNGS